MARIVGHLPSLFLSLEFAPLFPLLLQPDVPLSPVINPMPLPPLLAFGLLGSPQDPPPEFVPLFPPRPPSVPPPWGHLFYLEIPTRQSGAIRRDLLYVGMIQPSCGIGYECSTWIPPETLGVTYISLSAWTLCRWFTDPGYTSAPPLSLTSRKAFRTRQRSSSCFSFVNLSCSSWAELSEA